jgi:hypothetical protein
MILALPGRSRMGHLTDGGCASAATRVMYDITAETLSVWHLGRSWAGSYR